MTVLCRVLAGGPPESATDSDVPGDVGDVGHHEQWGEHRDLTEMGEQASHDGSLYMGQLCRDQGIAFEDKFGLPLARIAAYGGAFL